MERIRFAAAAAGAVALSALASAHDFWLEPSKWTFAKGDLVTFDLSVGDNFRGEVLERDDDYIAKFEIVSGDSKADLLALPGRAVPAAWHRPAEDGWHFAAFESKPREIKLTADKFRAYLAEEGLEHVIEARKEAGEDDRPGHEHYVRCAKSILLAGARDQPFDDPLAGLTLEFEALSNPEQAGPFKVRLLYRGKPLEGALVTCERRVAKGKKGVARAHAHAHGTDHDHAHERDDWKKLVKQPKPQRSDKDGVVKFDLEEPGEWLISSVHMERIDRSDSSQDAKAELAGDWLSHWASLTFNGGNVAAK